MDSGAGMPGLEPQTLGGQSSLGFSFLVWKGEKSDLPHGVIVTEE